jgi:Flp pilus assembly pilin Flp
MKVVREEDGQTTLEYVLIIAVLILVIIAAIPPLREAVTTVITGAQNKLVVPTD